MVVAAVPVSAAKPTSRSPSAWPPSRPRTRRPPSATLTGSWPHPARRAAQAPQPAQRLASSAGASPSPNGTNGASMPRPIREPCSRPRAARFEIVTLVATQGQRHRAPPSATPERQVGRRHHATHPRNRTTRSDCRLPVCACLCMDTFSWRYGCSRLQEPACRSHRQFLAER